MRGSDRAVGGAQSGYGQRRHGLGRRRRGRRLAVAVAIAVAATAVLAPAASAGIHKGNYTCYQAGYLYWGQFEVKQKNKYKISGGKGKFKVKNGKKLIFKKGPLKKWGWKGRYSTGRSPGGVKEWQIDLIDRKNGIKINCYD
jgi:hypothetical protein